MSASARSKTESEGVSLAENLAAALACVVVADEAPSDGAALTAAGAKQAVAQLFLIAAGGTGGHVLPAVEVARELRLRGHECVFVGAGRGMEQRLYAMLAEEGGMDIPMNPPSRFSANKRWSEKGGARAADFPPSMLVDRPLNRNAR